MTSDTDFAIVPIVFIVPIVSKKVFTRYVIVENNNIYISDIIISIIYTLLITPGSEITSQEKKSVFHPSIYIGKMDGWKHPHRPRGYLRGCPVGCSMSR